MAVRLQSVTEGPLGRQMLRFSLPLMLSNVLQVLFNMSDIAVVGQFAGSAALGAVGSTTILVTLFTGLVIGMGGGVNVLAANYFGAKRSRDLGALVHTAALVCLLEGLLLLAVGVGFARGLLAMLHTKDELMAGAVLYLRLYFLCMPAAALFNYGSGVLCAVGETKRPLYYLLGAGVLNVLLNLFFVIVCRLDVAGVALASVIAQYVSAALVLAALVRSPAPCGLRWKRLRLDGAKTRALLVIGVPSGLQNAIFAAANLFIQAGVNSFNATVVAGNAAAANADGLVYDMMAAFYTACSSFIGQNYGARKRDRILRSYFLSLAYSFGLAALLGGLLVLFGREFLALFTPDAAVAEAGLTRLRIMGLSYAFSAFMDCTIAASRGLGRTLVPTVLVVLGSCVFRVIWVYTIFAWFGTITSLYLLYIFSWSITAVAEIVYFARLYRKLFPHSLTELRDSGYNTAR